MMTMQIVNAALSVAILAVQIVTLRKIRKLKRAQATSDAQAKPSGLDHLFDRRDRVPDPEAALVVEVQASDEVTEEVVRRLKAAWKAPVRIVDPATDLPMASMYGGRSIAEMER